MTPVLQSRITVKGKEILALTAKGLEEKQIASELRITQSSVKERKQVLFKNLGAVNSAHAVAIGKDKGLI